MEQALTEMHERTNQLFKIQTQLKKLRAAIPRDDEANRALRQSVQEVIGQLKSWDEEMVQRKSKAYDDVENFPNKFTAEYLFLINQTESDLPRVTQSVLVRRQELDARWHELKQQSEELLKTDLPNLNRQLWESEIGAIWQLDRAP